MNEVFHCLYLTWKNVKFRLRDPILVLGGGLYQSSSIFFKMKNKYPIVINWVYTHLLISFQYCSNNQFWYNNHGSWNLKKSKNFPKFHQFFGSILSWKSFILWRFWNNNYNQWFFDSNFFSKTSESSKTGNIQRFGTEIS